MAFTASLVSCSSKEMCSDMWNLYSGTHPDLHDDFMDPPERIMVHPQKRKVSARCSSEKDKNCFNVYYGAQCTSIQNPYTTSAVMEVESHCAISINNIKSKKDVNGNQTQIAKPTLKSTPPKEHSMKRKELTPKQSLTVPEACSVSIRRNKSDSDISSLDDNDIVPRARIMSDSSAQVEKRCVCECTCGYQKGSLAADVAQSKDNNSCQHKSSGKSRHKSRSLKGFLHSILS